MKQYFFLLACVLVTLSAKAQSYTSANYASAGDTIYLTKAQTDIMDFESNGTGITWNLSALAGVSQTTYSFANPNQTGISILQFPYIFNSNNANLAQTNGETLNIGTIQISNAYDYFKKSGSLLQQTASAYKLIIGGIPILIKNSYTNPGPDILYKFPVNYNNADSSSAGYISSIPYLFYRNSQINRVNRVVGSGTVVTPYGTFSNALKLVSEVTQTDSISIDTLTPPKVTTRYREIKFLDASKKYPLIVIRQNLVNEQYITGSIEYLDNKQFFQPVANFVYAPLCAMIGDTVYFQNLSYNSTNYSWDFDDPSSGSQNTSTDANPTHVFSREGTYHVKLIGYSGAFSDTTELPRYINSDLSNPAISVTCSADTICSGNPVTFYTNISNGGTSPLYQWKKNNAFIIGENSDTLVTANISSTDTIQCQLISSSACFTNTGPSISNKIAISTLTVPAKPGAPAGTTELCLNPLNQTYATTGASNAITYEWAISPAGAGTITGTGIEATVDFDDAFEGSAQITVTGQNNCGIGQASDVLTVRVAICNSISENSASNQVVVYPNPSNGRFSIEFSDNSVRRFEILNSLGQKIVKKQVDQKIEQIELNHNGVYLLRFYSGKTVITKQLTIIR